MTENLNPAFLLILLFLSIGSVIGAPRHDLPYAKCFDQVSARYALDPDWLIAISIVESSLNPKAVSKSDAIGLMQIKWPLTASHLGVNSREALFQPCFNIEIGGKYLRELLDRFDENKERAATAYRIGPTRLAKLDFLPTEAVRYLEKINDQLRFLAPAPPKKEAKIGLTPVRRLKEKPLEQSKALAHKLGDTDPSKVTKTWPTKAIKPICDVRALQVSTLSTHDPRTRENRFLKWLENHSTACDADRLRDIRNQAAVWLGTADTRKTREKLAELLFRLTP